MENKWMKLKDEIHEVAFCTGDDIFYMLIEEVTLDLVDIQNMKKFENRSISKIKHTDQD